MIVSFSCKDTEKVANGQWTKKWGDEVRNVAMRRLSYLAAAIDLQDLRIPPSNRLHPIKDDLKGYHSISINMQWRIIFKWQNGNAYDVKIMDSH